MTTDEQYAEILRTILPLVGRLDESGIPTTLPPEIEQFIRNASDIELNASLVAVVAELATRKGSAGEP